MSSPPSPDLAARLAFAHRITDETDRLAFHGFSRQLTARYKADGTQVTEVDTAIERRIRELLADAYPADAVMGEELGTVEGHAGRWIVDPIDATHNFVRGIAAFATLLAFERGEMLELGVVSAPALGQRWFAVRDGGAFVRDARGERPIHVSRISRLDRAHVLYGSLGHDPKLDDAVLGLARRAWRNRGFGDFWGHVLVASGSADMMVEDGLKPWDLAAPAIVVEEAGGRVTDFEGRRSWLGPQALSTNGELHDAALAALARQKTAVPEPG